MEKYRLVKRRGEGTFAEVWEVESRLTGHKAAVKILKKNVCERYLDTDLEYQVLSKFVSYSGWPLSEATTTTGGDESSAESTTTASSSPKCTSENLPAELPLYDHPAARHPGIAKVVFHPHILGMYDAFWQNNNVIFVMELLGYSLLEEILRRRKRRVLDQPIFTVAEMRIILWQILKGVDAMHSQGIFHRDIKPENILMSDDADGNNLTLKIADLGSSQFIRNCPRTSGSSGPSGGMPSALATPTAEDGSPPICTPGASPSRYTEYIATRWYRSPECLLTAGWYGAAMDIWAVGCVCAELLSGQPLFPGEDEIDQLRLIHAIFGNPSRKEVEARMGPLGEHLRSLEKSAGGDPTLKPCRSILQQFLRRGTDPANYSNWFAKRRPQAPALPCHPSIERWKRYIAPRISPSLAEDDNLSDLLYRLLAYYPQERITAAQALDHKFFAGLSVSKR